MCYSQHNIRFASFSLQPITGYIRQAYQLAINQNIYYKDTLNWMQLTQNCNPKSLKLSSEEIEEWIPQKKAKSAQKINKNRWTNKENKLYVQYLKMNKDKFKDKEARKKGKVFLRLAKQIKKRTYEQVKSHHQKMIIKYKSIDTIIREFEASFILQLQIENPLNFQKKPESRHNHQIFLSQQVQNEILDTSNVPQLHSENKMSVATGSMWDLQLSNEFLQWFEDP